MSKWFDMERVKCTAGFVLHVLIAVFACYVADVDTTGTLTATVLTGGTYILNEVYALQDEIRRDHTHPQGDR